MTGLVPRFFCPRLPGDGAVELNGSEARHLAQARRLKPGDEVELFDGQSPMARRGMVRDVFKETVCLELVGPPMPGREPRVNLTLATALPKGERFDWLIEKAVETGVGSLVPLRTYRSVVEPRDSKLDRARKAVIEACKQCGRNRLMRIDSPRLLFDLLGTWTDGSVVVAQPGGASISNVKPFSPNASVLLVVGPEGGLIEDELISLARHGATLIDLAPAILRVETAAIVGAALIQDHCDRERGMA